MCANSFMVVHGVRCTALFTHDCILFVQKLLVRLETRLAVKTGGAHECTALLRRLFPRTAKNGQMERYPTRVFLCAYMILNHPEVVFNRRGEREAYLSSAAKDMIDAFEHVIEKVMIPGASASMYSSGNESSGGYEPMQRISSTSEWEMKVCESLICYIV